ncbi:E3 ubiquitin-protein ligase At3g02290 isoform X2 [Physcomitrium patens]|uniref:E3 ubiquitin-protein ligase At3g02290 isoform X2 n=1 Tax=Physcomitrium patens TaxID=3218 RepID=UPI000D15420A|nr:E3 ubiquitin-protein ligase At3g02290-like isoform X2 [Physcomitrium patens]|eukprot:XP_024364636.1 E3 ubiquitin-protein ligase At3g02290-like isoform X2 [Physcomitrella patens]
MGSLCCCLSPDHLEDYLPYQSATIIRECPCVRCCMRWFFSTHYSTNFDELDHQENIFPSQVSSASGAGSVGGSSSLDTSIPEVFQAPPTPLPYDSDPRYLRSIGRDGLNYRRDKSGMSQMSGGEGQPLRHSNSDGGLGGTALQRRFGNSGGLDLEEQTQGLKLERTSLSSKAFPRVESALSMLDDEDVCPTCLDGYTVENPRITTECGHYFHLSCIYEWMERSNHCPLCDKDMVFDENF